MDSRDPSSLERKALNVPCRPARLAWKTVVSTQFLCTLSCRSNIFNLVNSVCFWYIDVSLSDIAEKWTGNLPYIRQPNDLATPHSENYRTQKNPGWLFLWGFKILEMFLLQSIQSARLSVQSSELCPSTLLWVQGGKHSLAGEGVGGPNSDEGTNTLVLYVYYNPSTVLTLLSKTLAEFHFAQKNMLEQSSVDPLRLTYAN